MGRLLEELHSIPPTPAKAGYCKIGGYLRSLEGEMLDDFKACLVSELSARGLSRLFRGFDIDVGSTLIKDHRAKRCSCYSENE